MKKIKIHPGKRKYAAKRSWNCLTLIAGFFGTIVGAFVSINDFVSQWYWRFLVALLIYTSILVVLFSWYYFKNKVFLKKRKLKISINKGDILDKNALEKNDILVFAVDSDYTMELDETFKISPDSIHGQFLKKFSEKIIKTNNEDYIKKITFVIDKNIKKHAFLVPLTKIKQEKNCIAELIEQDILPIFKKVIEKIDGSNFKNVLMPILSSGETTPTTGYLSDKTNLIRLWIILFQIYCRENKKLNLNFFVTNDDWCELRFSEI